jgi:hypothetical protein
MEKGHLLFPSLFFSLCSRSFHCIKYLSLFFRKVWFLVVEMTGRVLTDSEIEALVAKYAPTLCFHTHEQYFPCTIGHLLHGSTLLDRRDSGFRIPNPTQQDLYNHSGENYYVSINSSQWTGMKDNLPPMYYAVQNYENNKIQIHYILLYAYQGGQTFHVGSHPFPFLVGSFDCVINDYGKHQGDIEHVVVTLDNGNLSTVGYEAHGDITYYTPSQVKSYDNGHPIVNVALNGHSCHNGNEPVNESSLPTGDDVTAFMSSMSDSGIKWRPTQFVRLGVDGSGNPINDQVWVTFQGRLGIHQTNQVDSATYLDGSGLSSGDWAYVKTIGSAFDTLPIGEDVKEGNGPGGLGGRAWIFSTPQQVEKIVWPSSPTRIQDWRAVQGVSTASFLGKLYLSFSGTDGKFYIVSSNDGITWGYGPAPVPGWGASQTPSLAVFNNKLYVAYQGGDSIYIGSSSDGKVWNNIPGTTNGWKACHGVSLATYLGNLYLAFPGADGKFYVASSNDGITWVANHVPGWGAWQTPSLAVFNNTLYVAYEGGDSLYIGASSDGKVWNNVPGNVNGWKACHGVSLTSCLGNLYLAFPGADGRFYVASSNDGFTWNNLLLPNWASWDDISLVVFNNALFVASINEDKGVCVTKADILISSSK